MGKCHRIEYTKRVKSKQTRASIYYVNTTKPDNNISHELKEITFLPNYSIRKNEILLNSQKPEQFVTGVWTIKPETELSEKMKDCKNKLEQKLHVCGKLFSICINQNTELHANNYFSCGSFSVVKFNESTVKAVSALHVVNSRPFDKFDEYIFGSFKEKISEKLISKLSNKFAEMNTSKDEKINSIRKFLSENFFYEFSITPGYLKRRRDFLNYIQIEKNEKILLDPEYNLQPQPSVDMVFLDLPEDLITKINKEEFKPLKISQTDHPKVAYLVAYHDCKNMIIEKNSTEYCITDFPEEILMSNLLNENKSLGQCLISAYSPNLITYLATTGDGSSGGCILDEDGDIIAINFGNYFDDEEEGKSSEKLESYDFTSKEENKKNYFLSKNTNLAINLKHEFIDFYFKQELLEDDIGDNKFLNRKLRREELFNFP